MNKAIMSLLILKYHPIGTLDSNTLQFVHPTIDTSFCTMNNMINSTI